MGKVKVSVGKRKEDVSVWHLWVKGGHMSTKDVGEGICG